MSDVYNIEAFFYALRSQSETVEFAEVVLKTMHFLHQVIDFDPSTHGYQIGDLDSLLLKLDRLKASNHVVYKDRVYMIAKNLLESFSQLQSNMRHNNVRNHQMLPAYRVRELDNKCIQWLSQKPGRNIQEKLAITKNILGVQRQSSYDTAENRLMKAVALKLESLLFMKEEVISMDPISEELFTIIKRWLNMDIVKTIGPWSNLPPNNTLLSDKYYKKIWNSHLKLRSLDQEIEMDWEQKETYFTLRIFLEYLQQMSNQYAVRFTQQPIDFCYDALEEIPLIRIAGCCIDSEKSRGRVSSEVQSIDYKRATGYIKQMDAVSLKFTKQSCINPAIFKNLKKGDWVTYSVAVRENGPFANYLEVKNEDETYLIQYEKGQIFVSSSLNDLYVNYGENFIQIKNLITDEVYDFDLNENSLQEVVNLMLQWTVRTRKHYSQQEITSIEVNDVIIDICSIRPSFISNNQIYQLPFRMLKQKWDEELVDCNTSKAVNLSTSSELLSIKNLILNHSTDETLELNHLGNELLTDVSDYLKTKSMQYIVPDWVNVFEMEHLRRNINLHYTEAQPLPKSIAAIVEWQQSEAIKRTRQHNLVVLVIDTYYDGIVITPVKSVYLDKIKDEIPETKGMTWERHPSHIIRTDAVKTKVVDLLEQDGCPHAEELYYHFDNQGFSSESDRISFWSEEWYHLSENQLGLGKLYRSVNLEDHMIQNAMKGIKGNHEIKIINNSALINANHLSKKLTIVDQWHIPLKGAYQLKLWQAQLTEQVLWRDHLPELSLEGSMDGVSTKFHLVKNNTVEPQRDKDINIDEIFKLEAGKPHYRFPLIQGAGNEKVKYYATLHSSAFPLKETVPCHLKLQYSYGDDDPYQLSFIPVDPKLAGFNSVQVKWTSMREIKLDDKDIAIPHFPEKPTWESFNHFKTKNGNITNLYEWFENGVNLLKHTTTFHVNKLLMADENERQTGYLSKIIVKENSVYCFVQYNRDRLYCNDFVNKDEIIHASIGDQVYFNAVSNKNGIKAVKLSKDIYPKMLEEDKKRYYSNQIRQVKLIKVPVMIMFNYGNVMMDPDMPTELRNTVKNAFDYGMNILETSQEQVLQIEMITMLSCFHSSTPQPVIERLLTFVKEEALFTKHYYLLPYSLGDCKQDWQQEIFDIILKWIDHTEVTRSKALASLSVALWRHEDLVNKLTVNQLMTITNALIEQMKLYLNLDFKKMDYEKRNVIFRYLELTLALLRTRQSEDELIRELFRPYSQQSEVLWDMVSKYTDRIIQSKMQVHTKLQLQINRPKAFERTPELLYALRLYLTGDSGANTIIITGVSDE